MKQKRWSIYHYNVIAKEIRELFPLDEENDNLRQAFVKEGQRASLTCLALSFANRFYEDWMRADEGVAFDPKDFLNQCSPDEKLYPLEDLWQEPSQTQ